MSFSPARTSKKFSIQNLSTVAEAFSPGENWEDFVRKSYASKVPLSYLEPFVGRYVKAISACGVQTHGSCDGNHPERGKEYGLYIEISCKPNIVWHEVICRRCLAERFNLTWSRGYSAIEFNAANKWQTYVELNRAAEFLYNNRLTIRQIRREASDAVGLKNARTLPSDDTAKIFSERANELFDKVTLQA